MAYGQNASSCDALSLDLCTEKITILLLPNFAMILCNSATVKYGYEGSKFRKTAK